MQRLSGGLAAALSIMALTAVPACKGEATVDKADSSGSKSSDADKADGAEPTPAGEAGEAGEVAKPGAESGAAPGPPDANSGSVAEAGAAEAGAVEPPAGPDPAVLLEQAANLDTDDAVAKKALEDAVVAGAAKLDVAKVANTRGEGLLTKGESERAEPFFVWARDAHNLFSEPVFNLAKLAAYAGDLEVAKEHLQELEKRGNKKLLKKVGVEPAFTPLLDDPDVRKLFEQ